MAQSAGNEATVRQECAHRHRSRVRSLVVLAVTGVIVRSLLRGAGEGAGNDVRRRRFPDSFASSLSGSVRCLLALRLLRYFFALGFFDFVLFPLDPEDMVLGFFTAGVVVLLAGVNFRRFEVRLRGVNSPLSAVKDESLVIASSISIL